VGHYTVKQVIVMRRDLGMTRGKEIAQGAHASMAVLLNRSNRYIGFDGAAETRIEHWPELTEWLDSSFAKICVRVESEQELLDIIAKARAADLPVAEIRDRGFTMFHGVETLTCCAIGPVKSEVVDQITGHLKLL
jgi:PTH2 family peptidyl-tRNA hydrolase